MFVSILYISIQQHRLFNIYFLYTPSISCSPQSTILGNQCKREITACTTLAMELPPANPLRDTLVKLKESFEALLDEPLELTTTNFA